MNRFFAKSESDYRHKNKKMKKNLKKINRIKWRKSGTFPKKMDWDKNFFKIIFEKALDFLDVSTHTKRAFKLRRNEKKS